MDVVYAVFAGAKKRRLVRACLDTLSTKIRDAALVLTNQAMRSFLYRFSKAEYFRLPC
jgi:hypothetical protein